MSGRMTRVAVGVVLGTFLWGGMTSCAETSKPEAGPSAKAAVTAPAGAESGWIAELFGNKLVKADGSEVDPATLAGKKIGIYFSAHWCPPCRGFTPVLVKTCNELVGAGKAFEVVFISFDRSAEAMAEYMKGAKMPWPAVPFQSEALRKAVADKYGVRGIPSLVVLDDKGKTVSKNARGDVESSGAAAFDKW